MNVFASYDTMFRTCSLSRRFSNKRTQWWTGPAVITWRWFTCTSKSIRGQSVRCHKNVKAERLDGLPEQISYTRNAIDATLYWGEAHFVCTRVSWVYEQVPHQNMSSSSQMRKKNVSHTFVACFLLFCVGGCRHVCAMRDRPTTEWRESRKSSFKNCSTFAVSATTRLNYDGTVFDGSKSTFAFSKAQVSGLISSSNYVHCTL